MSREEAITTLKEMRDSFDEIHENTNGDIGYEQMTAIDMAIEALSADAEQGFRGGKIPPKEMLDGTVLIPQHQWLEMERELAELKSNFESAVAVVRCKDCINYETCNLRLSHWWKGGYTVDIEFCSFGERKQDD